MNQGLRNELINIARSKRIASYSALMIQNELDHNNVEDRNTFSEQLAEISIFEDENHRPLLSAIVVYKERRVVGPGFYAMAEAQEKGNATDLKRNRYDLKMRQECWDFWSSEPNIMRSGIDNLEESEGVVAKIANSLNDLAISNSCVIGRLPQLRRERQGKKSLPNKIFASKSIFESKRFAFHYGGRWEPQFNFGEEVYEGRIIVRYSLSVSLQASRSLTNPIARFEPFISRMNEFILEFPDLFKSFKMWFYSENIRSNNFPVEPISSNLLKLNNFISIGSYLEKSLDELDVNDLWIILQGFDRLFPLYENCVFDIAEENQLFSESDRVFEFYPSRYTRSVTNRIRNQQKLVSQMRTEHESIQLDLERILSKMYLTENVAIELSTGNGMRIDAAVRTEAGFILYEVKTYATVKQCLRAAIGQLFEYALWPTIISIKELVVVSNLSPTSQELEYLKQLQNVLNVKLSYQKLNSVDQNLVIYE